MLKAGAGGRVGALGLAVAIATVVLGAAAASSARIINLTIENKTFSPKAINVHDGDVLHICNRDPFIDILFSFSQYNKFGGNTDKDGLKLTPNKCTNITAHNPTGDETNFRIASQSHAHERLLVAVYPKGAKLPATPPTGLPAPSTPGTYTLDPNLTKVTNLLGSEMTVTSTATGQGIDDHTGPNGGEGKGGEWRTEYHWAVPTTLVPGKAAAIYIAINVSQVNPEQPILFQISARAPDFSQVLPCHYPNPSSASKTYTVPIAADQAGQSQIQVLIDFDDVDVAFTYKPTGK
jgi:hypothetical protein